MRRFALPSLVAALLASCAGTSLPVGPDARPATPTADAGAGAADGSEPDDAGIGEDTGVEAGPDAAESRPDARAGRDASAPRDAATPAADASTPTCELFGRFGVPTNTFTLPGPDGSGSLYVPDVQARFPAVDWQTLDRLYVPAGDYKLINLGNLPNRDASRPLVITNLGGQVRLFPPVGSSTGYLWSLGGGSNWVLTGRYDPDSRTGDASFPGHRCGDYAHSRSRYGFLSDDAFRNGGHMGLGVTGATRFEVEFVEITRSGFAGLRVNQPKAADGTVAPLEDVRLHDLYIHDTKSEGIYFGSTQGAPTPLAVGLQIHDNRIVRTGTEALQVQNLGPGTEIHHNVMAFGALDWRAAFQTYQDNNSQAQLRQGDIRFHHNVFMGGAAALLNLFSGPEGDDPSRQVEFSDNYFADGLNLGIYFGGTSGADSSYVWKRNAFRGLDFGYDSLNPAATDYGVVFRLGADVDSPVQLVENTWEGSKKLLAGLTGGAGTVGKVTASGNVNGPVPVFEFVESGFPNVPTRRLELWTDVATLAPGKPAMAYAKGALVMHDGELYEALADSSNKPPPEHPALWRHLALPVDDLRTRPGTSWAQRGVGLSR